MQPLLHQTQYQQRRRCQEEEKYTVSNRKYKRQKVAIIVCSILDFEESSCTSLPAKPNSNGVDGNSSDMDAVTNRRRSERRYVSNDAGESSSLAATASLIGVEEIAAESDVVKTTTTTTTTKIKKVNGKKRASRSLEDEKRSCARREDKEESKQWRLTANLLTVHQRLLVRDIDKEGTYSFASITEAKPPDL